MKSTDKKYAVSLGIRVSLVFLIVISLIFVLAYHFISKDFQKLMIDNTNALVEKLGVQGAELVRNQLESDLQEIAALSGDLSNTMSEGEAFAFPENYTLKNQLRMVYVDESGTRTSDHRKRDVSKREDIKNALESGMLSMYGPYYNEENEFVVCYTAPIAKNDTIIGALSVEKDGFLFSEVIKNIRFGETGESYIIDENGTDIAVSDQNHIEWVTERYNSQEIYDRTKDETTKRILEVEKKGLAGKSGRDTYIWNDGLVYLSYHPIQSTGWVLIAGLREEEIIAMANNTLLVSISQGPVMIISLLLFIILIALIIFWIISSMRKNAEINEKLEIIASHDSLTNLYNRRFLETKLSQEWIRARAGGSEAAVFMMDLDDFKNYNDCYGHPQGDECLCTVADIFRNAVEKKDSFVLRYGGEEFVAVIFNISQENAMKLGEEICQSIKAAAIQNGDKGIMTVSIGICYLRKDMHISLYDCIEAADKALYQAKKDGKDRVHLLLGNDFEGSMDKNIKKGE